MFENKILTTVKSKAERRQQKLLQQHAKSRERLKRSLESSGDEGDNYLEHGGAYYEDSQALKKVKGFAPEDTYEIWVQEPYLNQNFNRFLETKTVKKENDYKNRDWKDALITEEGVGSNVEAEEKEPNDSSDESKARAQYIIKKQGLEILPHIDSDYGSEGSSSSYAFSNSLSYPKKHTTVVSKLLHLNILRKNWKIAYRCFCLLIRIHHVDIRSIWPLGVEILTRLAEEQITNAQPEGSIDEYKLRTYPFESGISLQLNMFKDEQFITWLQNFYGINNRLNPKTNYVPLPYRVGTRDTPPVFMLNLIWASIMKQNFSKVNQKLSELLLQPPYINDGVYYFLQGFSYQLEATRLSKKQDLDRQQVEKLMFDARKFYQEARDRNADFPEELVNDELTIIEKRIAQDIDFERDLENSDFELEVSSPSEEDISKTVLENHGNDLKVSDPSTLYISPERARNLDSEDEDDYNSSFISDGRYRDFDADEDGGFRVNNDSDD